MTAKTTKTMKTTNTKKTMKTTKTKNMSKPTRKMNKCNKTATSSNLACNKQWLNSKKVRPKTVVIVAERTQSGYRVKSATIRVAVNQHAKTAVPITDLNLFVNDIREKGFRN